MAPPIHLGAWSMALMLWLPFELLLLSRCLVYTTFVQICIHVHMYIRTYVHILYIHVCDINQEETDILYDVQEPGRSAVVSDCRQSSGLQGLPAVAAGLSALSLSPPSCLLPRGVPGEVLPGLDLPPTPYHQGLSLSISLSQFLSLSLSQSLSLFLSPSLSISVSLCLSLNLCLSLSLSISVSLSLSISVSLSLSLHSTLLFSVFLMLL